jgi:type IV secretory pathway VirB2 component (pilin)
MRLRSSRYYWHLCGQALPSSLAVALVTYFSFRLHFNAVTVVLLYLLVIVWQSLKGGFALAATVAMIAAVCLDFFFLPPLLSLQNTCSRNHGLDIAFATPPTQPRHLLIRTRRVISFEVNSPTFDVTGRGEELPAVRHRPPPSECDQMFASNAGTSVTRSQFVDDSPGLQFVFDIKRELNHPLRQLFGRQPREVLQH